MHVVASSAIWCCGWVVDDLLSILGLASIFAEGTARSPSFLTQVQGLLRMSLLARKRPQNFPVQCLVERNSNDCNSAGQNIDVRSKGIRSADRCSVNRATVILSDKEEHGWQYELGLYCFCLFYLFQFIVSIGLATTSDEYLPKILAAGIRHGRIFVSWVRGTLSWWQSHQRKQTRPTLSLFKTLSKSYRCSQPLKNLEGSAVSYHRL